MCATTRYELHTNKHTIHAIQHVQAIYRLKGLGAIATKHGVKILWLSVCKPRICTVAIRKKLVAESSNALRLKV